MRPISPARIDAINKRKGGASVHEARLAIQRTMQDHAGVFRFADMLKKGVTQILEVEKMVENLEIKDKSLVWQTRLGSRRWRLKT